MYLPQKLQELLVDLGRGFMLKPVARSVDFDTSNKTRKAGAELVLGQVVELPEAIVFPHHEERRLGNLRALERSR